MGLGNAAPALALIAGLAVLTGLAFSPLGRRILGPRAAAQEPGGLPPAQAYNMLQPGKRYRVIQAFVDYDQQRHEVGESWTFQTHSFLPYEDGLSWFVSPEAGVNWQIRIQSRPENVQQYEVAGYPERFLEEVA